MTALCAALCFLCAPLAAQTVSTFSEVTPPSVAPGAPSGSYALSGFEHYSPFTGQMGISIPLAHVGGRGQVGYTIPVTFLTQWADTVTSSGSGTTGSGTVNGPSYVHTLNPAPNYVATVFGRTAVITEPCSGLGTRYVDSSVSRLVFAAADGTQTEMVDSNTLGQPYNPASTCGQIYPTLSWDAGRGTTFVSHGGSARLEFIADSNVLDYAPQELQTSQGQFFPSGYLRFPDGSCYRIDNGSISWMEDRNGNRITITSSTVNGRPATIYQDAQGRQTTFVSGDTSCGCDKLTYPGVSGNHVIQLYSTSLSNALRPGYSLETLSQIFTNASYPGVTGEYNPTVISYIKLADGTQYTFLYNSLGELAQITLPTGGVVQYDIFGIPSSNENGGFSVNVNTATPGFVLRHLHERRQYLDSAASILVSRTGYSYNTVSAPPSSTTTTETTYDSSGNVVSQTVHSMNGAWTDDVLLNPVIGAAWTEGQEYQTASGTSTLQTVARTYSQNPTAWCASTKLCTSTTSPANNPHLITEKTTLSDANLVKQSSYGYDAYNNLTDAIEYDWGSGAPGAFLRHSQTAYAASSSFISLNMVSLPASQTVEDANGVWASNQTFSYDEQALQGTSGISGQDPAYTTSNTVRGNVTTSSSWLQVGQSYKGYLSHHYTYDNAGNVLTDQDPKGNTTTYTYADGTYAHLNTITYPSANGVQLSKSYAYDPSTDKLTQSVDENGLTTTYTYAGDPFDRLLLAKRALGTTMESHTAYSYPSATEVDIRADESNLDDGLLHTSMLYDGLGRIQEARQYESGSAYIATDTSYDALGHAKATTNPYRSGDTIYSTVNAYDTLGRLMSVTNQDGSVTTVTYSGNQTTTSDPAGVSKTTVSNALGQLTSVTDATGATSYSYDLLGDLTGVSQGTQTRTFSYDSLRRLLSASNPENGTVAYSYDNNGNLLTRTDARNVITSYAYDALNRISGKSYSDGTTSAVSYVYGDSSGSGYQKGRVTQVSNGSSTTNYTGYTALGGIAASTQVTGGQTYAFAYGYNLAGALTSQTYPTGRVVTTSYDAAGRQSAVSGSLAGQTTAYVTAAAYFPQGAEQSFSYGNAVVPVYGYNSRLQMSSAYATVGNNPNQYLLYLAYGWGTSNNNGNLQSSSEGYGSLVPYGSLTWLNQSYSYDGVNRLASVTDSGYSRSFGYDRYGNGWVTANSGVPLAGNTPTPNVFNGNNQISGGSYDAAGNETLVNGNTLAYDAESRQISVAEPASLGGGVEQYYYDGDGKRVEKTGPAGATILVYDAQGRLAAEYGAGAAPTPCSPCYLMTDLLGTPRLVTDQDGHVVSRHDYLPFGEEIAATQAGRTSQWGTANDSINQKFTGKERDSESGLDYFGARYYGSALGRFTSPDPDTFALNEQKMRDGGLPDAAAAAFTQGLLENPQDWNKYSYVRNNPLALVDPTGAATADGHHLIPNRENLVGVARQFAEAVKTGIPSIYPNSPGFNEMHRAYNQAVGELLTDLETEGWGPRNGWSLDQWKQAARVIIGSDEPAIRDFLDELEANGRGAHVALFAAINAFRPSAAAIARTAISALAVDLSSAFDLMLVVSTPEYTAMQDKMKSARKGCLLDRSTGNCAVY